MMKNGKLFGKLNLIDLLIIVIILAAAVFVGKRYFASNDNDYGTPEKLRLSFFATDAPALLADKGELGSPVIDFDNVNYLGSLTEYSYEPSYKYELSPVTGEPVPCPQVNQLFLSFACEGEGFLAADGLRVNGTLYAVGGSYTIRFGQNRVFCRLASVEVIG